MELADTMGFRRASLKRVLGVEALRVELAWLSPDQGEARAHPREVISD
jgi:hypothetical protein